MFIHFVFGSLTDGIRPILAIGINEDHSPVPTILEKFWRCVRAATGERTDGNDLVGIHASDWRVGWDVDLWALVHGVIDCVTVALWARCALISLRNTRHEFGVVNFFWQFSCDDVVSERSCGFDLWVCCCTPHLAMD